MSRPWQTWLLFALCLAIVFGAMGWVSGTAARLERSEREARAWAAQQENVRLALWRMDSAMAPLIAQESARPYFAYSAFYPAERAYNRMFAELRKGEVLVPSPLLTAQSPFDNVQGGPERQRGGSTLPPENGSPQVILYFQFGPDGELTLPQAPTNAMRALAESGYTTRERIEAAATRLARLGKTLNREALLAALPPERPASQVAPQVAVNAPPAQPPQAPPSQRAQIAQNTVTTGQADNQPPQQVQQKIQWQQERTNEEYNARAEQNSLNAWKASGQFSGSNARELAEGVLKPVWAGGDLVLARRVRVEGREYLQGCLLDWPGIRASLLATARPLLPRADLVPAPAAAADEVGCMMASLPVRLVPGPHPPEAADGVSPIWLSLGIAWTCVLAAAAGGAVVLARAISLSERRGAFVSAVTHELRTPLTTFKMYAEMLAEDMVPDEAKRRQYLQTLRTESVRLGHLVENVLAYARLERGRATAPSETITLEELMARQRDRLAARAEQAGMQLVVEPGEHWQAMARVETSSVEQILFNLVDNACKYAGRATDPFGAAQGRDRRIHIIAGQTDSTGGVGPFGATLSGTGRRARAHILPIVGIGTRKPRRFATLTVRDHGPGISQHEARRLFHAFRKSARDAANSAPGIGLGLALSCRLARRMGGGLRLDPDAAEAGACFTLLLPAG